ncbi:MAG: 16S rRNA pseudouridine(516) synthase, partial [Anaerorhabdus sp.]
ISTPLTIEHIRLLEDGITIDGDELCKPAKVNIIDDHRLELTISEGKYHQIKRMMIACDSEVTYLKRLTIGPLTLDDRLEEGDWRYCTDEEVELLRQ